MKRTTESLATLSRRSTRRRLLSAGVMALLGLGVGCKARVKKAPPAPPVAAADSTPADAVEPAPVAVAPAPAPAPAPVEVVRPTCDQFLVTENGAAAVMIGDPRDSVRTRCNVLADSTTADPQGTVQGRLIIGVGTSTLVAQIANDRVNGIFVTDAAYRTADGLGPGMPLAPLLQLPGAIVLEGVNDLSIVVSAHCGLYFQIPKPATGPVNGGKWAEVVSALPPGTSIDRVVVRGCH